MKKRYITIGIFFLLFILMTILMLTNNTTFLDENIYNYIFSFRNDFLDLFFKTMTKLGNTITVIIILIILVVCLKKEDKYSIFYTIITTILTNQIIKNIIRRPRPDHIRLINEGGYSYPSGHSMISIALYGFLIYLVYKNIKNKVLKSILIALLFIVIIGIGLSRVYLGVHYLSDVLAGFFLTIPILILIVSHFRGNINDKDSSI